MTQQAYDLRASAAILRRRWRLLARAGVVGLVLGLAYALVVPGQVSSISLVLLPTPAAEQSAAEVETQVRIAISNAVLDRAGQAMAPALSAREVGERVEVVAPTTQLLEIRAYGRRARDARALSQAVADAYLQSLRDTARTVSAATLSDLRSREGELAAQVKALQTEIDATATRQRSADPNTADGRREAQLLAQLRAEQANMSLQLDKVRDDIATSAALGGASRASASIIQPAAPALGAGLLVRLVRSALFGFLLAAVGAAVAVLVQARRDPRVRARDDIADAVGSSVLAGVRSRSQRSVAAWSALLESYQVGPVEAWAFRQVLRTLMAVDGRARKGDVRLTGRIEYPRSLTVISLSGDDRGLAIGPQLAVFASSLGIVTRLVAAAGDDRASALWAACATDGTPRPDLYVDVLPITASSAETSGQDTSPDTGQDAGPVASRDDAVSGQAVSGQAVSGQAVSGQAVSGQAPAEAVIAGPDAEPLNGSDAEGTQSQTWRPARVNDELKSRLAAVLGRRGSLRTAQVADDLILRSKPRSSMRPPQATGEPVRPQITAETRDGRPVDLTIVLAVLDSAEPSLDGVAETSVTLLSVAPGTATRADLARLAVAVDDAGRRIDGIVVADPDAWDRTTGRHTLDERARQAALPIRVTGIGSVPAKAAERGRGR